MSCLSNALDREDCFGRSLNDIWESTSNIIEDGCCLGLGGELKVFIDDMAKGIFEIFSVFGGAYLSIEGVCD